MSSLMIGTVLLGRLRSEQLNDLVLATLSLVILSTCPNQPSLLYFIYLTIFSLFLQYFIGFESQLWLLYLPYYLCLLCLTANSDRFSKQHNRQLTELSGASCGLGYAPKFCYLKFVFERPASWSRRSVVGIST